MNTEGFNSEFGEDAWVAANLRLPERGVYVDAGCGHPVQFSNSAFLRARGWDGVAIDGNPAFGPEWKELAPAAKFFPAVLSKKKTCFFDIRENSATSRLDESGLKMEGRKLEEILAGLSIEEIDFLSMDLEGAEYEVFRTMDLKKHRPRVIVAEYNTQGIGEDFRLRDHLLKSGLYDVVHQTVANLVYVLREGVSQA